MAEENVTTQTQTTETVTAPSVETPQVTTPSQTETPTQATEQPVYAPNFKYNSMGKEFEIEEDYRTFIKDKDTEEKIRKLFCKGAGLEHYKGRMKELEGKLNEVTPQYQGLYTLYNDVVMAKQNGDYETILKRMNIPKIEMMKWAAQQARLMEDPQGAQSYNQEMELKRRASVLEQQNQMMQQQHIEQETMRRQNELEYVLSKPEVKQFEEVFNQRLASRGRNLFQEICQRGLMYHNQFVAQNRREPMYHEVPDAKYIVEEIMEAYGHEQTSQAQPTVPNQPTPNQPQGKPPVIPVVPGGGTKSVAGQKIKSIADIEKMAQKEFNS